MIDFLLPHNTVLHTFWRFLGTKLTGTAIWQLKNRKIHDKNFHTLKKENIREREEKRGRQKGLNYWRENKGRKNFRVINWLYNKSNTWVCCILTDLFNESPPRSKDVFLKCLWLAGPQKVEIDLKDSVHHLIITTPCLEVFL